MIQNSRLITIRTANLTKQADLEAIAKMKIVYNIELRPKCKYDFYGKTIFNREVSDIKHSGKNLRFVLAYVADNAAGFGKYFLNNLRNQVEGRVCFVYPEFRNFGVGGALLKEMKQYAKDNGYNSIRTFAAPKVQHFHEKGGFVRLGKDPSDQLMILKLK